jgi:hypothetical protein
MMHFMKKNGPLLSEICIPYLYEFLKPGEMVYTITINQFELMKEISQTLLVPLRGITNEKYISSSLL